MSFAFKIVPLRNDSHVSHSCCMSIAPDALRLSVSGGMDVQQE